MFLTDTDIENAVHDIASQMYKDQWRPDYIVGITRGGLVPAVLMSHQYDLRMHTLDVRLRDGVSENESNCWMAEDAFGYMNEEQQKIFKCRWDPSKRKKILILDDINDTGATYEWIKNDWRSICMPDEHESWNKVFQSKSGNVKFASIVNNLGSDIEIDYTSIEINKAEKDHWIVFPWEKG